MRDVFVHRNLNRNEHQGRGQSAAQRRRRTRLRAAAAAPLAASATAAAAALMSGLLSAPAASAQTIAVSMGIRETGTTAAIGANGGGSGGTGIEWVNKDGLPLTLNGTWQQFTFHFGTDPVASFTGNGILDNGTKGVLEHIRFLNANSITSPLTIYMDDFVNTVSGTPITLTDYQTDPTTGNPLTVGQSDVMFRSPNFSGSTNSFIVPGSTAAVSNEQSQSPGQSYKLTWQWINNDPSNWVRLTTSNTPVLPNPTISYANGDTLSFWLRGTTTAVSNKWVGPTGQNWNNSANWSSGDVPDTNTETANLLSDNTGPVTINVDTFTTINTLNIDSPNSYTIAGPDTLAFNGPAGFNGNINVNQGSHTISAAIEMDKTINIFVVGGATLNMSGGVTGFGPGLINKQGTGVLNYTGGMDMQAGTGTQLLISAGTANFANLDVNASTFTVTVSAGANLTANRLLVGNTASPGAVVVGGTLKVNPSGTDANTSRTNALTISGATNAWTGTLDLTNNKMVIDYTGASPVATIANQIKSGYAGGAWTGKGINSSSAAAAATSAHKTAIGYGEASALGLTTFGGQPVDADAVVMRYTYTGDANLDGKVDTLDFNSLAGNFGGTGKVWTQADFNYDGVVDTLDFNNLAANFGQQLAEGAGAGALVPEPASVAILGLGLAAGLARRRRTR